MRAPEQGSPVAGSDGGRRPQCQQPASVVYKKGVIHGKRGGHKLKLDLARPKDAGQVSLPPLIFIHYGGWQDIGRHQFCGELKEAAQQGFVAATIDHRLTDKEDESGKPLYPWPACFRDTVAAVRFLRAHAEQYNIDKNHIGITGHSSGGHLALMLATASDRLKNKDLSVWPNQSSAVQAAVGLSTPTDLKPFHKVDVTRPILEDLLGGPPEDRPDIYRAASPIHHIHPVFPS